MIMITYSARCRRAPTVRRLAAGLVLLALGAITTVSGSHARAAGHGPAAGLTPEQQLEFEQWYDAQPRTNVPISAGDATVLIVRFSDFQCPACASTYFSYRDVLKKYEAKVPGLVKMVAKDFPLDSRCNTALARTMHPAACDAAAAVALAARNNKRDEMEEWLYANQAVLTPPSVRDAARTIGLVQDFEAGYKQVENAIKADIALGRLLGVNATPTHFINGTKLAEPLQAVYFDAAIAYELRKAGKLK